MRLGIITAVTAVSLLLARAAVLLVGIFVDLATFGLIFSAGLFLALEFSLLYGIFERRAPIFGPIFWKGSENLQAVCLTFDDGPNEPFTSQILDILKQFKVKATFFVIGKNVERFPDTIKRALSDGHQIGNHTFDHHVLPLRAPSHIRDQIRKTADLIEKLTSIRPQLFRAPHGWRNPWVSRVARQEGCIPVAWTWGVWDTNRPGSEKIIERTVKGLRNGCILLLHDGRGCEHPADASQMVQALPVIIREARRAGYEFLTVAEMLDKKSKGNSALNRKEIQPFVQT